MASELRTLTEYVNEQRQAFRDAPADAAALTGEKKPSKSSVDAAVWILVARVIMNTDEFLTRE